jgi:hypothetical protein
MFSPNTGESLQDYPLATWPAQNLTRTFNCTPVDLKGTIFFARML